MKVTRRIGRVFKPLVNFPRWMNLDRLMANGRAIIKMFNDMKVRRPPVRQETFEEAMLRMHLTEDDIKERIRNTLTLSIVYSVATLIFLIYTLYMIFHGHIGMIIGLLITVLMATFTYRESFWYFQLKTRTLGNTFHDWARYFFRGRRK